MTAVIPSFIEAIRSGENKVANKRRSLTPIAAGIFRVRCRQSLEPDFPTDFPPRSAQHETDASLQPSLGSTPLRSHAGLPTLPTVHARPRCAKTIAGSISLGNVVR